MKEGQLVPLGGGISVDVPWLRPPHKPEALFARRAARLDDLAAGHSAGEWLAMLARLCAAQAVAAEAMSATARADGPLPVGETPLRFATWPRHSGWRDALGIIVRTMQEASLPAPARDALARLGVAPATRIEAWADALLAAADDDRPEPAAAPFLAAALQVYFSTLAATVKVAAVARQNGVAGAGCPVCGFAAVAGIVQGDDKVRYLCCGLCASDWHVTRVQCTLCRATGGISYHAIEGAPAGVKAETCAACRVYLKLFYREQRPFAEPLADGAASLALDLLLGEAGYSDAGVNLLVVA